jgi:IclR family acetate operon transcriptional repressor
LSSAVAQPIRVQDQRKTQHSYRDFSLHTVKPSVADDRGSLAPTHIQSVSRASRLLLFVAEGTDGQMAKQCADALGLPLATTHHLLSTLVAERLLSKDGKRRYHLGPKVGALADAYQHQLMPPDYLLDPLRRLADVTAETAHLCAWRHGEVVALASVEGSQAVRVSAVHTGLEGAANARASGKLLLALAPEAVANAYLASHPLQRFTARTIVDRLELERELEQIRSRGYAIDDEEFARDVACVAAPIAIGEAVIGAYSVSAPLARFRERTQWLIEAVRNAARAGAGAIPEDTPDAVTSD